jgi:hypothetical protein
VPQPQRALLFDEAELRSCARHCLLSAPQMRGGATKALSATPQSMLPLKVSDWCRCQTGAGGSVATAAAPPSDEMISEGLSAGAKPRLCVCPNCSSASDPTHGGAEGRAGSSLPLTEACSGDERGRGLGSLALTLTLTQEIRRAGGGDGARLAGTVRLLGLCDAADSGRHHELCHVFANQSCPIMPIHQQELALPGNTTRHLGCPRQRGCCL